MELKDPTASIGSFVAFLSSKDKSGDDMTERDLVVTAFFSGSGDDSGVCPGSIAFGGIALLSTGGSSSSFSSEESVPVELVSPSLKG